MRYFDGLKFFSLNNLLNVCWVLDDYFVGNMEKIDGITTTQKEKLSVGLNWKLKEATTWKNNFFKKSIDAWPCNNLIKLKKEEKGHCAACEKAPIHKLVMFYGQPYDAITLSPNAQLDRNLTENKVWADYFFVSMISVRFQLNFSKK